MRRDCTRLRRVRGRYTAGVGTSPDDLQLAQRGFLLLRGGSRCQDSGFGVREMNAKCFVENWKRFEAAVCHPRGRFAAILAIAVFTQACLGILTLLLHVPLAAALIHQAGAMIVLALAVWNLHTRLVIRSPDPGPQ